MRARQCFIKNMMFGLQRGERAGALAAASGRNLEIYKTHSTMTLVSTVGLSTASHSSSGRPARSRNQTRVLEIVDSRARPLPVWFLCVFHPKYLPQSRSKSYRLNVRVRKKATEECHPGSASQAGRGVERATGL